MLDFVCPLSDNSEERLNGMEPTQPFHPVQGSSSLPDRVAEQLRSMIIEGELRPGARLSNEPDLAMALSVSRSTLRSALDRLVRDGLIVRRRGVGTFVAPRNLLHTNLNANIGATGLIRASGATPGLAALAVSQETPADDRVIELLELEPTSSVIVVRRVRTANNRRVILAREYLPTALLQRGVPPPSLSDLEQSLRAEQSLHAFFKKEVGLDVHHGVARLRPAKADGQIAAELQLPAGNLVMYLEQVDYEADGKPLLLSDEYWVADAFTFSVHRMN
jgi:GntR family transcriptional regulator